MRLNVSRTQVFALVQNQALIAVNIGGSGQWRVRMGPAGGARRPALPGRRARHRSHRLRRERRSVGGVDRGSTTRPGRVDGSRADVNDRQCGSISLDGALPACKLVRSEPRGGTFLAVPDINRYDRNSGALG